MLAVTGRAMLASIFILSGAMKLVMHEQGPANPIMQYMSPKMDGALASFHSATGVALPIEPEQYQSLVFVAGSMELLGGLLFVLNVKLGAILLMAVLVFTTLVMHNFWDFPSSSPAHQIEFMNFLKNVSIFGAFLMFAATKNQPPAKYKLN